MLINNLMNVREICEAFHDIEADINILYDAACAALDEEDNQIIPSSNNEIQELEEIVETLENLTAYI